MNNVHPHKHLAQGPEGADLSVATITISAADGNKQITVGITFDANPTIQYSSFAIACNNSSNLDMWVEISVSNSSSNATQCPVKLWGMNNQNSYLYSFFGSDMDSIAINVSLSNSAARKGYTLTGTTQLTQGSITDVSCVISLSAGVPQDTWTMSSANSIQLEGDLDGTLYYYLGHSDGTTDSSVQISSLPLTVPASGLLASTVNSITFSSDSNGPVAGDPTVAIYRADQSSLSIIQDPDDSSKTIAVPYAVTPDGSDNVTVQCLSLATGATEVTVWPLNNNMSEGTTLAPAGSGQNYPASTSFDASTMWDNNLALSWDEGTDPKVVIKSTGCDD